MHAAPRELNFVDSKNSSSDCFRNPSQIHRPWVFRDRWIAEKQRRANKTPSLEIGEKGGRGCSYTKISRNLGGDYERETGLIGSTRSTASTRCAAGGGTDDERRLRGGLTYRKRCQCHRTHGGCGRGLCRGGSLRDP